MVTPGGQRGRREQGLHVIDGYQFETSSLESPEALARDWSALERVVRPSFFLSWNWISVWLEVYRPRADVLRVRRDGETVALALLVRGHDRRHAGLLTSRTLHLHQTGLEPEDQIWIEYNGMLTTEAGRAPVYRATMRFLVEHYPDWDEFVIGAVREEDAALLDDAAAVHRHDLWTAPCYGIDLADIRRRDSAYLDTLSRNTRYQIRRAVRLYEEQGALSIRRPQDTDEAVERFREIGPLHLARWGGGAGQSGFANPEFMAFHEALIRRHWDEGNVDVIHIRCGEELISAFYNLRYQGSVYFYLSGVRRETDPRLKPGLVGHALCIQEYLDAGADFYDFMGGGERYKSSLGQLHQQLVKSALQRPRLRFRLEGLARAAKHRLLGQGDQP